MIEEETHPKKKFGKAQIIALAVTLIVIGLAIFFGVQLVTKTGLFHQPGKLVFDDSMTEVSRDFITENTKNLELKSDLTISAKTTTTTLTDNNTVLYDILVPVTDFYNPVNSVSVADAQAGNLVSIRNLNNSEKLLAIDAQYYLDSFDSGAFFEYFVLEGNEEDVKVITEKLTNSIAAFPDSDTVLTFAQTGVTALSRNMNTKLGQVQDATYFAEKIGPFLSGFDLTHTSSESSFSNSATKDNICSKPEMIDALTAIGLDIVELTGNHNQDCGDNDALATIEKYHSLGIKTFGGGTNATTAAEPLIITEKGTGITLLGYNLSTGGYTLDDTPGANFYTVEKAKADIAAAKERGDFIIVDVQYYECNAYADPAENTTCDYADSAEGDQIGLFRSLIDMGADIVVGTSAHQPQTYELYGDGAIYYGLGNLFFDQSWWPGTTRSLILVHYFYEGNLIQTRIVPTVYDQNYQTAIMDATAAGQFLTRLNQARPKS